MYFRSIDRDRRKEDRTCYNVKKITTKEVMTLHLSILLINPTTAITVHVPISPRSPVSPLF